MEETVKLSYDDGLAFDVEVDGHKMKIDSVVEFGGRNKGPRPKNLMLVALGGCTGMDVASIMSKMKIPYDNLEITVTGILSESHPRHFEKMHITYMVKGNNIDRDKVERAVYLSQEKYCGVTFNYKSSIEITHEIKILPS